MKEICKPTLLLDEAKVQENLNRMVSKAKKNGLHFRPHFKTHQSHVIAAKVREAGIRTCTVSSVQMAAYFADGGWDDITIAFPANIREAEHINQLADRINLNLIVEDATVVGHLVAHLAHPVGMFIKIDAGYHRTGIAANDHPAIEAVITAIESSRHLFKGFLIHDGHTYKARGREEVAAIHAHTLAHVRLLRHFHLAGRPQAIISLGDTPSFSLLDDFTDFEEMRPGNFIFYDLAQWQIGSCQLSDIAVCMACPVVSKHPDRREIVVYGGGVHFSKDRIFWEGKEVFGLPGPLNENGWGVPDLQCYVKSLSQEHGIVQLSDEAFARYQVGDLMGILPVHSCLTAQCMGSYRSLQGQHIPMLKTN